MSRKDYIAIAAILRNAGFTHPRERRRVIDLFARMFEEDNSNFDKARFVEACTPKGASA